MINVYKEQMINALNKKEKNKKVFELITKTVEPINGEGQNGITFDEFPSIAAKNDPFTMKKMSQDELEKRYNSYWKSLSKKSWK